MQCTTNSDDDADEYSERQSDNINTDANYEGHPVEHRVLDLTDSSDEDIIQVDKSPLSRTRAVPLPFRKLQRPHREEEIDYCEGPNLTSEDDTPQSTPMLSATSSVTRKKIPRVITPPTLPAMRRKVENVAACLASFANNGLLAEHVRDDDFIALKE